MAVKKQKTPIVLEYEKQLRRIKQFIYRVTKRGISFEKNPIPQRPKTITEGSVRRLQKLTPKTLYEKATATSETGTKITGTQKRVEERITSGKKGAKTRRRNIERARAKERKYFPQNDIGFEEQKQRETIDNFNRISSGDEYYDVFNEGGMIWERILGMIEDASRESEEGAEYVLSFLMGAVNSIDDYTLYTNLKNNQGEALKQAELALRYFGQGNTSAHALHQLIRLIIGRELTAEESIRLNDLAESNIADTEEFYSKIFNKIGR